MCFTLSYVFTLLINALLFQLEKLLLTCLTFNSFGARFVNKLLPDTSWRLDFIVGVLDNRGHAN